MANRYLSENAEGKNAINSPRVCIQVQSVYIGAQSSCDDERYVFAYTVTIPQSGSGASAAIGPLLADYQWSWP